MDYHFITFYRIYQNNFIRLLRVCIFNGLVVFIIFGLLSSSMPTLFLGLLNIFVMLEIFYRYKVSRIQSTKIVTDVADKDALLVMTFPALSSLHASNSADGVIRDLLYYPQV